MRKLFVRLIILFIRLNNMTLSEIKEAVDSGKTVCWSNDRYQVVADQFGYLIGWDIGGIGENYIGLTSLDGVTLNGKEEEFYIKN